jgi:hypothetical protein
MGHTVAVVELGGKGTLGDLTKSVEAAATPHKDKAAPGVHAAVAAKLTDEQAMALMKLLHKE